MPLTHIALRRGKPPEFRAALVEQLYAAMREAFDVPPDDLFVTITQHEEDEFYFDRSYLGIERDEEFLVFRIIANNTRTTARKKEFYKTLAERLGRSPGVAPRNVFVNIVETSQDNWSFGDGVAQYAQSSARPDNPQG